MTTTIPHEELNTPSMRRSVLEEANARFWCDLMPPALLFGCGVFTIGVAAGVLLGFELASKFFSH